MLLQTGLIFSYCKIAIFGRFEFFWAINHCVLGQFSTSIFDCLACFLKQKIGFQIFDEKGVKGRSWPWLKGGLRMSKAFLTFKLSRIVVSTLMLILYIKFFFLLIYTILIIEREKPCFKKKSTLFSITFDHLPQKSRFHL